MSFWESLALVGTMATILGVFLTIYAMINNKMLKEESRNTRDIINRWREEWAEEVEKTRELIERMDRHLERMDQQIVKEGEKIDMIARLIVREGERTRETILSNR